MKKIAVTGGLASGKTSVCQFLQDLGAYVVSADAIVHQLLSPDTALGKKVIQLLDCEASDGQTFDHKKIACQVFQDPKKLQSLENLLHPAVYKEIERLYQQQLQQPNPPPLFVAEIPLLFESTNESSFDAIIAVVAPEGLARMRFVASTGYDGEEFTRRMQRQLSPLLKIQRSHFVIFNDSDLTNLKMKTEKIFIELSNR